jgi:DNA-binding NtrC family response regulator
VLARELHYASARLSAGDPDELFEIAAQPELSDLERELRRAAGETLLIEEVEGLSEAVQLRLARALDPGPAGSAVRDGAPATRIVATSRIDPTRSAPGPDAAGGALERDTGAVAPRLVDALARRLDRLRLWTPPLCERRNEIPALVAFLAARFAEEEGLARVRPTDEALALLWRQPWHGNLRELEGLVHKLALLHAGSAIGPDEVQATALRFRLELVPRLPSRRPDRAALRAALDATRTAGGRVNKTRAALYLGWDPDTLVARLAELGLDGEADETGAADPEEPRR